MKSIEVFNVIHARIDELGFESGCLGAEFDLSKMTKKALWQQVLPNLDEDATDVFLRIRGRLYVCSISTVYNEKDVVFRTGYQFFDEFGGIADAFDCGKISEEEYQYYMKQFYGESDWTWDEE